MVVLLSLVGVILGSGAASQVWLHRYTQELKEQMEQLSYSAGLGEEVQTELRAISSDWEEYQKGLGAIIREESLNEVEKHIKKAELLTQMTDQQEIRQELVMELREAADAAEELWQKEKVSLQNIL